MNNITYYILPDHLDTPRKVVDASGNLRWKWNSDAFGNGAPNENPAGLGVFSMNLRFPGQYADVETGLYYNNARYYDPLIGRYIQSDPIGLSGGINTYSYVTGNPLKFSDFSGLFGCPAGMTEVPMPEQENAFPKIAKCQPNSSANYSPKICLTGECAAGLKPKPIDLRPASEIDRAQCEFMCQMVATPPLAVCNKMAGGNIVTGVTIGGKLKKIGCNSICS